MHETVVDLALDVRDHHGKRKKREKKKRERESGRGRGFKRSRESHRRKAATPDNCCAPDSTLPNRVLATPQWVVSSANTVATNNRPTIVRREDDDLTREDS
jgi:hypothetical protein